MSYNYLVLFMVITFFPFIQQNKTDVVKVENVIVYNQFLEAGKTAVIIDEFNDNNKTAIDSLSLSDFCQELTRILGYKSRRLRNRNIVVEFAGEFYLSPSEKHYFVIAKPYHLIDLTEMRIYYITDVQSEIIIRNLIKSVKRKQGVRDNTPFSKRVPYNELPDSILNVFNSIDINESPILNNQESAYIKAMFFESDRMPDLTGKKILFHYTNRGQISKKEFFTEEKEGHSKGITPNVVLYLFNEEQKKAVGGYDAYVVLWSKITYNTEDMVKRLSKKTENVRY